MSHGLLLFFWLLKMELEIGGKKFTDFTDTTCLSNDLILKKSEKQEILIFFLCDTMTNNMRSVSWGRCLASSTQYI